MNSKHTIEVDGITYARLSPRGLEILKQEYEKAMRHLLALINLTSVFLACGIVALSSQSIA